jgi:hypothetical protein
MKELAVRCFILLIFAIIVPVSVGIVAEKLDKTEKYLPAEKIVYGFLFQLAIAEIIGVICVLFHLKFRIFAILYL